MTRKKKTNTREDEARQYNREDKTIQCQDKTRQEKENQDRTREDTIKQDKINVSE